MAKYRIIIGVLMKHLHSLYVFSFFLFLPSSTILRSSPSTSNAHLQCSASEENNQNNIYIDLKKNHSNIAHVIAEISALDPNPDSPINIFTLCIEEGASAIARDEMIHTFE